MSVKKTGIRVKLESGPITDIPYVNNISIGQEVLVGYSYIEHRIICIINVYEEGAIEPKEINMEGENHEDETYSDDNSDYDSSTSYYFS